MSSSITSSKPIRLGVLGADRRGKISLYAHRPQDGFHLVAACSLTPERLGSYREACGEKILLTDDYRKITDHPEIDAVMVCTPDYLHEEHAVAALNAGKAVFLEKPMAIHIEEADRILQAAAASGSRLYVGHNMRFFRVMQKMRELIRSGIIGRPEVIWCRHFISYGGDAYFKDWHSERRYSNGLLLQKGAHDIDIIHYLAGSYSQKVSGMGKLSVYDKLPRRSPDSPQPSVEFNRKNWPPENTSEYSPRIDVEDHSMIMMQLANGVQASYTQCMYCPDDVRNYTVIGTRGRLENYGDHSSEDCTAEIHLWNHRGGYSQRGHEVIPVEVVEGSHGGADPLMVDDFLRFLVTGERQGATPLDARMAVAAACCGTESLRHGNHCGLEIPPPPAGAGPAAV
jgi:predicted dehydrogenase